MLRQGVLSGGEITAQVSISALFPGDGTLLWRLGALPAGQEVPVEGVSVRNESCAVALTISAQVKTCVVGSRTTNCVSNWVFGDCSGLPVKHPRMRELSDL